MADETSFLPEPTAELFIKAAESACGKFMSPSAEEWWHAWTEGRFENFKDHWEKDGQSLLNKFESEGQSLEGFAGESSHCSAADLKRWEDLLTAQGWQPDGSFRPTPFCIAQPSK